MTSPSHADEIHGDAIATLARPQTLARVTAWAAARATGLAAARRTSPTAGTGTTW